MTEERKNRGNAPPANPSWPEQCPSCERYRTIQPLERVTEDGIEAVCRNCGYAWRPLLDQASMEGALNRAVAPWIADCRAATKKAREHKEHA